MLNKPASFTSEREGVDEEAPAHHRPHREGPQGHRDQHTDRAGHARQPGVTLSSEKEASK